MPFCPARPRRQVHSVVPGHHCIRLGRTARAVSAQSEREYLCGALGQVRQGGVPVQSDPLRRALVAAGAEQLCRPFPRRAESPREVQRPAVSAGDRSPARGASEVPRAIGRAPALLSSRDGVMSRQSVQFFDHTRFLCRFGFDRPNVLDRDSVLGRERPKICVSYGYARLHRIQTASKEHLSFVPYSGRPRIARNVASPKFMTCYEGKGRRRWLGGHRRPRVRLPASRTVIRFQVIFLDDDSHDLERFSVLASILAATEPGKRCTGIDRS